jgi:hypothetical protein
MLRPPGSTAPTVASGALRPARAFGAPQPIGFRMAHGLDDLRDDDARQFAADGLDAFHFQADGGEGRAQRVAVGLDGHVLAQPAFVELHANCPRKRTSLSKKLRRSLTP